MADKKKIKKGNIWIGARVDIEMKDGKVYPSSIIEEIHLYTEKEENYILATPWLVLDLNEVKSFWEV